jgi:alpha-aminoadipate carrier protein LysW
MATCPECDAEIEVDEFDVDKGDQLTCPDCGSNLEVTGLAPIELDLADETRRGDDDDGPTKTRSKTRTACEVEDEDEDIDE